MTTKATRIIDPQGRVILPPHIRKALNLNGGNVVEVRLEDDGSIRIRPTSERCCICGEGVEGKNFTQLTTGPFRKLICYHCAQQVAKAMLK